MIKKKINYLKFIFRGGNNKDYNFTNYRPLRELFRAIYHGEILIPAAEREQDKFDDTLEILRSYKPRKNSKYYKLKDDLLINAQNFYDGRKMIIEAFKNKMLPLSDPTNYPHYASEEDIPPNISSDSSGSSSQRGAVAASSMDSEDIDPEITRHYFEFNSLDEIYKFLNKDLANKDLNKAIIDQALLGLKRDVEKLCKKRKQTTQLESLANSADRIYNDAINNQQGKGLKILTPGQMILRLPILLIQVKAGNTSNKLKMK